LTAPAAQRGERKEKDMSYQEYLSRTGQKDSRTAWKWWKIEICGMSEKQAIKAAYDPELCKTDIMER